MTEFEKRSLELLEEISKRLSAIEAATAWFRQNEEERIAYAEELAESLPQGLEQALPKMPTFPAMPRIRGISDR